MDQNILPKYLNINALMKKTLNDKHKIENNKKKLQFTLFLVSN